ncbi:MAG: P1 family peptidase [Pseudomonadota bacterium]
MALEHPTNFTVPIQGLLIGHASNETVQTGTTTILFEAPAVVAAHIMGGAPGTRETELLEPHNTVGEIDAIVLSGGSAYGLDAAGGAQAWLREHGRGIELAPVRIPIVPCAILFDMRNDGNKDWGTHSPYRDLGYESIAAASNTPGLGKVGVGYGANTANRPGGFGMASSRFDRGHIVSCAAVNAIGAATIADTDHFWAAPWERDGEFGGLGYPEPWPADAHVPRLKSGQRVAGTNTTLGVIVTDLELSVDQAKRIAISAHDGFARALYPVHTPGDGDIIFVASTQQTPMPEDGLIDLTIEATNTMTRAIARGVFAAGIADE